jgi:hypothetical protein
MATALHRKCNCWTRLNQLFQQFLFLRAAKQLLELQLLKSQLLELGLLDMWAIKNMCGSLG